MKIRSDERVCNPILLIPKIINFLSLKRPAGAGFIVGAVAPNWLAALPPYVIERKKSMKSQNLLLPALLFVGCLFPAGCGSQCEQDSCQTTPGASLCCPIAATEKQDHHEHGHAAEGTNTGEIIELGDGQYLAELIHDEAAHEISVQIIDAKTKKPVGTDKEEIVLQIFVSGQFTDYMMKKSLDDPSKSGVSQFTTVNKKLSDTLSIAENLRGRLKASIDGKPLTGIIERHAHEADAHDHQHDSDHDHKHANGNSHEHANHDH